MPKKKQVTFQNNIQGKFIPRNVPPVGSVFPSRINDNRFNAKMAELLASSSIINDENELVSIKSSQDNSTSNEIPSIDSSHVHSKLFHRHIVNMFETLKKSNDDSSTLPITSSHIEYKSQPITFGQLRQATISTVPIQIINDKTISHQINKDIEEKHDKNLTTFIKYNKSKIPTKHQLNKESLYYSPSFEKLLEKQNIIIETKKINDDDKKQIQKSTLTVDEILDMYSSKVKQSTNIESNLLPSSTYSNTNLTSFYMHPSVIKFNSTQNNQHIIPSSQLILNEQNRNRPPPPSYSSSIANTHRTTSTMINPDQSLIHPSFSSPTFEHVYSGSLIPQHLIRENSSFILSNSSSLAPIVKNSTSNNSIRPPPPHYQSPTSIIEHSHSTSSQQSKINNNNNSSAGFDREFSRLLYGKDTGKIRREKQKRKAFSDPVKKSIEEATKTHRRLTTNLNKTRTVKEDEEGENDDEIETKIDQSNIHKHKSNFLSRRRSKRQSNLIEKNLESTNETRLPTNSLLKQRIPSFLRVYSQASPSNDILLQWDLFNLSELESFNIMMNRLYKNENLARVQLYEIYRTALISILTSKKSLNTNNENNTTTTTAL
ncbi:unnamed protein product [Rotaria sordida]|uniref:SARAH domain-containing protein n=1 Tax=Rotaria sordida TaxID=392033 RepID=A0A815CRM1_9BILA|nr:unnamed protein product [Rotaria sordida]